MSTDIKSEIHKAIKKSFTKEHNIFASITLSDEEKTNKNDSAYLSPIFTNKKLDFVNLLGNEKQLEVEAEIEKDLILLDGLSGLLWENTLISIYEKYTSLCQCSEQDFKDVSYFQKKKFDTAIEKAGGDGSLAYLMIKVGFWDYLTSLPKNDEGTLKRLRARSYICLLISRAISFYLLNEIHLPKCNILDDGGGFFGMLFNKNKIDAVKNKLKHIKRKLIQQFDGNVNLLYVIKK